MSTDTYTIIPVQRADTKYSFVNEHIAPPFNETVDNPIYSKTEYSVPTGFLEVGTITNLMALCAPEGYKFRGNDELLGESTKITNLLFNFVNDQGQTCVGTLTSMEPLYLKYKGAVTKENVYEIRGLFEVNNNSTLVDKDHVHITPPTEGIRIPINIRLFGDTHKLVSIGGHDTTPTKGKLLGFTLSTKFERYSENRFVSI